MKRKSAFEKWFTEQHGKRPNAGNMSDEELRRHMLLGEGAGVELYKRRIWDAKQTSALYAWQARERTR